jgi:hypothetical protein
VLTHQFDEQFVDHARRLQHRLAWLTAKQGARDPAQAWINQIEQRIQRIGLADAPTSQQLSDFAAAVGFGTLCHTVATF